MNLKTHGLTKRCTLYLLGGYFLSFLLFYFANYLYFGEPILSYIWIFAQKLIYFLPPFVAAVVTLILYASDKKHSAFLSLIAFSAVRMIYFIPYFYLIFIYDGFDSVESISFGFLASVAEAIIAYILTLLAFCVMLLVIKKTDRHGLHLSEHIAKPTELDFRNPVSLAFAILSLIGFSYFFIKEIVDTVTFVIDFSSTVTTGEILYMICSYLFDLSLIFIYYFVISYIKNRAIRIPD